MDLSHFDNQVKQPHNVFLQDVVFVGPNNHSVIVNDRYEQDFILVDVEERNVLFIIIFSFIGMYPSVATSRRQGRRHVVSLRVHFL
jgi:hypothetical protein